MPVVCRPARAGDLEFADSLVVSSINNLTERHGFGPMAVCSPPKFQLFSLEDDANGLWVAEEGGRILGFAWSWVCGDMWFLAQLFVSPDDQGRSVGNELLKRTLDHAEKSGASNRVLITFSFNTVSQGLYIRHGLLPRFPIYAVSVSRERLIGHLHGPRYDVTPLKAEASTLRRLVQADEWVLGVSREKHHRYLINDGGARGLNLYDGSDWAGYAYEALPGHPVLGRESFYVTRTDGLVEFTVTAFSKPAVWYSRLGGPVTRVVQNRYTNKYLLAMAIRPR